jgi:hypothetical protein
MNKAMGAALVASSLGLGMACGETGALSDDGSGGTGGSAGSTEERPGLGTGGLQFVVEPEEGSGGEGASAESGGTGGTVLPPALDYCTFDGEQTVGDPEVGMLLDDFDDGDAFVTGNGKAGNWYGYGDEGGSQSPSWDDGDWMPEPGGLAASGYALHAVGGGYDSWGSGQGLSLGWNEAREQNCLYDASGYDGVSFWIRGEVIDEEGLVGGTNDSGAIRFGVTEPDIIPVEEGGNCTSNAGSCWDWHKTRIEVDECWHRYSFRFDELEQDGWGADAGDLEMDKMSNFNFEIAQGHRFDYWLDEVTFFVGDPPPEEEVCDLGPGGAGGAGGAAGAGNQ